ncbi:MAG: peptidylprolyl isomerase [bacterium]
MIRNVNDEHDISDAAIEFELKRLIQFYSQHMPTHQIKANMPALREQAREQAIGVRLLIREAHRQNITVTDGEIDELLDQVVDQAGGEDAFQRMLVQQGINEDLLRESLADSKRVDKLIRKITVNVPKPTEDEIKSYYDEHTADFRQPERRRAQHILIKHAKSDEDARKKAMQLLKEIKEAHTAGADFSDLAAAHSECPSGKKAGGSIGWVVRGVLTPAFDAAVFTTEIGKTSDVIETSLGLHVVLASATEPGGMAVFEDARKTIGELLMHNRRGKVISEFVQTLKTVISA